MYFLIVASPGLLIVDHIHFQYNGFLLGKLFIIMSLDHSSSFPFIFWLIKRATVVDIISNFFAAGILLWSLGLAIEGKDLASGLLFAVLINMKHLFLVLGPVYFVYLLRHHCRYVPNIPVRLLTHARNTSYPKQQNESTVTMYASATSQDLLSKRSRL